MKRIVPVITVTAIILCLAKSIQVKANDITNNYDILALQSGIELTSIIDAYEHLTTQQQYIAEYLVGAFNNIYLCARGFSYDIPYDQSNLQAQFSALGSKVFDFITTRIGWKSRVNEVFRQYLSSVIVYASGINVSFANWFAGQVNGQDRKVFIPYSEDAFDAWTTFYNDPSGDGIAAFGANVTAWNSGTFYDIQYPNLPWHDPLFENRYNDYIVNNSPVIYSNLYAASSDYYFQMVFHPYLNGELIDSLYVVRPVTSNYSYVQFGTSNNHLLGEVNFEYLLLAYNTGYSWNKESFIYSSQQEQYNNLRGRGRISVSGSDINSILSAVFYNTPFRRVGQDSYKGYYYLINHVYLVDDLTTLANKEEIYQIEDLDIVAPLNDGYILAPNDRMILPSFPGVPDDPLGFWDLIVDNSLDVNGDTVTDDDYHTNIVNNNVINNYYVSDDAKINVPVEWFENPYTDQLYEESNNFIDFVKDCIDCLGDFDIYMYGAIVVGLAGGIVKKLLL